MGPDHRLLIKTAVLMPEAKKDEITIVQIESKGYDNKQVTLPIVAMKGGSDMQRYVDFLVPSFPATIKLVSGEVPLPLVGSHCVDYTIKEDEEGSEVDQEEKVSEIATKSIPGKGSPVKDNTGDKTV